MLGIKDEKYLLVASDVHNDDQAFEILSKKAEDQRCLAMLYAGDLDIENCIIEAILQCRNFLFIPVQGNCDNRWRWTDVGLELPMYRTCSFQGLKIFISHGHMYDFPSSVGLSDSDFDVVINGHSHVNGIKKQFINEKEIILMNPGSPSRPRGHSKAPYGMIVFKNDGTVSFEIRALESDCLLSHESVALNKASVWDN